MINEKKLESDIENWFTEVGYNLGRSSSSYIKVLFKGVKEVLSVKYMSKKDRAMILIRLLIHGIVIAVLILQADKITVLYSDYLSQHLKGILSKLLYVPELTKAMSIFVGLNCFHGLGVEKQREEDEIHELFDEIRFYTGKKRTIRSGDEKVIISETPRLIRKIQTEKDTRIYMFQSKGILPEEWEKRKAQLEYILGGKIINFKRGNGKSMKLVIVSDEKFEVLSEPYRKMEAYDEQFERMGLVGKGYREVEVFGEIVKTKNFPQFIGDEEEVINGKTVRTTTFKSAGLTLQDFREKFFDFENVMNRLVVDMKQDKLDKQLYSIRTIDTKDELKELYEWSDDIIDEREGVLVLGEGRLSKVTLDLNVTPHGLLGGVTGSGKSVEMNCLINQGIRKGWYPVLIDFKGGLELGMFKDFSETGVLFEAKAVIKVLELLNKEHAARLDEFKKYPGVKNIVDYNKRVEEDKKLARIIVGIDEISELLDTSGKSKEQKKLIEGIEGKLNSLARLSRSTGINILAGTQRPDSNVLKGQIKNNLGARICGRMTDKEPSLMVLGTPDATKLPEDVKGRYMYSTGAEPVIIQGYFFKESDIKPGNYLKGRLLTIDVAQSNCKNDSKANKEEQKNNAEPYEDMEAVKGPITGVNLKKEKVEKDSYEEMREEPAPEVKENPEEKVDENEACESPEEAHKKDMMALMIAIHGSEKLTMRHLKSTGLNHETLMDCLLEIYHSDLVEGEKHEQLKLILFKENKLSNEEYSKKSNAEPFL